ncbi:hypothetical protein [Streptomyces cyaneofuscatus]|uniref:hypothetical protein n=1 Tax=Streptomyces cyaneofuscatus TaxID=66883 RepID=UPI0036DCACB3
MTASSPAWARARPSERARAAGAVVVEGAAAPVEVEVVEEAAEAVVPAPGAAGEEAAVVAPVAVAAAVEGAAAVAGEAAAVPVG